MTRKDYIALANVMRHALGKTHDDEQRRAVVAAYIEIIDSLEKLNGNFNRERFVAAVDLPKS